MNIEHFCVWCERRHVEGDPTCARYARQAPPVVSNEAPKDLPGVFLFAPGVGDHLNKLWAEFSQRIAEAVDLVGRTAEPQTMAPHQMVAAINEMAGNLVVLAFSQRLKSDPQEDKQATWVATIVDIQMRASAFLERYEADIAAALDQASGATKQ